MWQKHYKLNEHEKKLLDMTSDQFDDYMVENYPEMFTNRYPQPDQKIIVPMNFGFEIGKGWRHVLDKLCQEVKVLQNTFNFTLVFDQIKEKYGSARFYYSIIYPENVDITPQDKMVTEIVELIVSHYEEYTDYVCEQLGINVNPEDKIKMGGWYYGMGLEGFIQATEECDWIDENKKNSRKELALEYCERNKILKSLKDKLYYMNQEDLQELLNITEEKIKEKSQRKQ